MKEKKTFCPNCSKKLMFEEKDSRTLKRGLSMYVRCDCGCDVHLFIPNEVSVSKSNMDVTIRLINETKAFEPMPFRG